MNGRTNKLIAILMSVMMLLNIGIGVYAEGIAINSEESNIENQEIEEREVLEEVEMPQDINEEDKGEDEEEILVEDVI